MNRVVIYDSKCEFCSSCITLLKRISGDKFVFIPFEKVNEKIDCRELKFISNGRVYSGAEAIFFILYILNKKLPWWLYNKIPLFRYLSRALYRVVAYLRRYL